MFENKVIVMEYVIAKTTDTTTTKEREADRKQKKVK
jgi:hypothetical protein